MIILEMWKFHVFQKVFNIMFESRVWSLGMSGSEFVDIHCFINILEQMFEHHGFSKVEIVDFHCGFITILEHLGEAMRDSRQIRKLM